MSGQSVPACPNKDCVRFGRPARYFDSDMDDPVGGPCPACSANTDQVPATAWGLPDWAAQADSHGMDDAITYRTLIGEVPTLDDAPITVQASGVDFMHLADLSVAVFRQPAAVRVAERRVTPAVARELAALLTAAANTIEGRL